MTALSEVASYLINNAGELTGIVLPPLIDYLNKEVKNEQERFIVAFLVCLFSAIFLKWEELTVGSVDEVFTALILIFTQSQLVFNLYFKNSYVRKVLQEKYLKPENSQMDTTTSPSGA